MKYPHQSISSYVSFRKSDRLVDIVDIRMSVGVLCQGDGVT